RAARGRRLHSSLRAADRCTRHEPSGRGLRSVHTLIYAGRLKRGHEQPGVVGIVVNEREILERPPPPADRRVAYGDDACQFGDLRLPSGTSRGVVIVLHGGFWRAQYDLLHIGHMCAALTAQGYATWSVEYRRVGNQGGSWPGTFDDVAAGAAF